MSAFLTLLATYYVCESMAFEAAFDHDQALRCLTAYETPKLSYLSEDERGALNAMSLSASREAHVGYIRFRAWEAENPQLVEQFKDAARVAVTGMQ